MRRVVDIDLPLRSGGSTGEAGEGGKRCVRPLPGLRPDFPRKRGKIRGSA